MNGFSSLMLLIGISLFATEVFAIPDPGCYRLNPRCSHVPHRPGGVNCPPGEKPWIRRDNPAPHCRYEEHRRRRTPRPHHPYTLTHVAVYAIESATSTLNTVFGGKEYVSEISGDVSLRLDLMTREHYLHRSGTNRTGSFYNVAGIRRYLQRFCHTSYRSYRGLLEFSYPNFQTAHRRIELGLGTLSNSARKEIVGHYRGRKIGTTSVSCS